MGAVYFSRCPITGTRCAAGHGGGRLQIEKMQAFITGSCFTASSRAGLRRAEICAAVPDALSGSVSYCLYPETRYQLGTQKTKLGRKPVSVLLLIAFYVLAAALLPVLGTRLVIFLPRYFLRAAAGVRHGCGPGAEFAAGHTGKLGDGPEPHADGFCGKRPATACRPRCPQWSPPSPQAL